MNLGRICLEDFAVDPQLGNFPEASPAQRLVLRLLDGLPPANQEQAVIFEGIAGRPWGEDLRLPRRIVAFVAGADSGKSLIAALFLLHRALFADLSGVRPGQRGIALLVAPDARLSTIPLNYARGIVAGSPLLQREVEGETTDALRFRRGTEIRVLPATIGGRAVRGWRFVAAVLEECAFFRDVEARVNDQEIVRAVRPRLLPGAQMVGISTPWARRGWLYQTYSREFGESRRALVLQAGTEVMRPDRRGDADLEEQRADDPESAAAELGAQFLENTSGLFENADLDAVTEPRVTRREPEPEGWKYVAAMDPSGLRADPWAFTILGARRDQVVQCVSRSWKKGAGVEGIVAAIHAEMEHFGISHLLSDQYAAETTKALFARGGITVEERPFTSSPDSPKARGFRALRDLVVRRRIALLDDPELLQELRLLEVIRLAGGGERIAAPGRLHDDRACALALACSTLTGEAGAAVTVGLLPEVDKKALWGDELQDARAAAGSMEIFDDTDLPGARTALAEEF